MKPQAGFTLIELLVTVSVLAVLLTIAVPSFQNAFTINRVSSAAVDFNTALNLARSEAVRQGVRITLLSTSGNNDWSAGWTMFADLDADNTLDAGETVLRRGNAMPANVTLRSSAGINSTLAFTPTGRVNSAGIFAMCNNNALIDAKLVIVNNVGRIRGGLDSDGNRIPETDAGTNLTDCANPS
ncbi:MAG: GspH/FimT family pseudopilin [Pseudomonadota bacterium]